MDRGSRDDLRNDIEFAGYRKLFDRPRGNGVAVTHYLMSSTFSNKQLEALTRLGLSKTQAVLYLTSLKHGMLSVLELSKLTNVSRQQIYEDSEKLIGFGLYEITRRQGRKYIAANPSKLIKFGKGKIAATEAVLSNISSLLPSFEALVGRKKNKVTVKHYEGLEKLERAFDDELAAAKDTEVLSFAGSIDDVFRFFPEVYWDKWNKKFIQQDSRSRMLVHNSESAKATARHDQRYKRETRWLHNFPLKTNVDVFNDTVLIVSFYDEMAIWIESRVLAESYRIMFNTLWESAKPFK
jgi:sugar-specific transcriptional regulator TrmB